MAAINFPNSPQVNDTFSANSLSWRWNGTVWQPIPSPGYSGSVGYSGSIGYTGSASTVAGYTGSWGYFGSSGYTGSQGYWGSVGYNGSLGSQGYWGSTGYSGSLGSQGYWGSAGYSGSIGYYGSTGYTGSASTVIGYWGSVGYSGSSGYVGSTGVGYTGSWGYFGSVGYTGSASLGGMGDGNYNQTALLLHFDGTNGDTRTYDSGAEQQSIVLSSATISSAQAKFGSTSLYVPSGSRAYTTTIIDLYNGSPDYTIEIWAYPTAIPSGSGEFQGVVIAQGPVGNGAGWAPTSIYMTPTTGYWIGQWNTNNTSGGDSNISSSAVSGAATLNAWSHLALTRQGSTYRFYVNGVLQGTTTGAGSIWNGNTGFTIGMGTNSTYKFIGYLDEARVTKGIARYTGSSLTVPTAPFPDFYAGIGYTGSASTVVGYTGSWGYFGSTGYTGSFGYFGSTGYTGSASTVIGYWGSVGYTGSVGSQGYWGSVGYSGSVGYVGSAGYTGSASTTPGYSGSIGYTGSTSIATSTTQSFTGTGSQTAFTLSAAISNQNNAIVTVNGLVQKPTTHYTISGTALTFTTAPYSNASIEVRNIEYTAGIGYTGSASTIIGYTGSKGDQGDPFLGLMLFGGM